MLGDTIAAISTPRGKGGVALLRLSGPQALSIAARVFVPKNGKILSEYPPRTAIYGTILSPDPSGEWVSVDDGIATVFASPASFTGEDTVEICCHGGILLTETVLTALLVAGARPAEAGEFTRRAYLNAKLGLSAAEALGNVLEAQTREQLTLAHSGLQGKVEAACREIYDLLCRTLASIYVKIDYPDEDLADMSREEIVAELERAEALLLKLVQSYRTGHAIAEGIPTVICGCPNVGKSSLYNRIVGREAAIVTDVEGTTRDVLCETASLGRVTLRLFDTAGLHDTQDRVEQIGIERAREAMEKAELILAVFDGSRALCEQDKQLIETLSQTRATVVAVLNKADQIDETPCVTDLPFGHAVSVSAKNGSGMAELTALIEELFTDGKLDSQHDAVLTNARQHAAAMAALEAVRRALSALRAGYPIDLSCADVEQGMEALAEIDGRAVSETIVDEIFSHFCVGK